MIIEKSTNQIITPTVFSDGTQQVWKLEQIPKNPNIWWYYEGDHEIMTLLQLERLLEAESTRPMPLWITCPWMPYGRQDKKANNDTCFGLSVLLDTFKYIQFVTLDLHGTTKRIRNISPEPLIGQAVDMTHPTAIVFADKSAMERYCPSGEYRDAFITYFDKSRDQATGKIEKMRLAIPLTWTKGYSVLLVDDICDGGATFVRAASILKNGWDVEKLALYTTHGIYSKGVEILYEMGYDKIITTNSRLSADSKDTNVTVLDCVPVIKEAMSTC